MAWYGMVINIGAMFHGNNNCGINAIYTDSSYGLSLPFIQSTMTKNIHLHEVLHPFPSQPLYQPILHQTSPKYLPSTHCQPPAVTLKSLPIPPNLCLNHHSSPLKKLFHHPGFYIRDIAKPYSSTPLDSPSLHAILSFLHL